MFRSYARFAFAAHLALALAAGIGLAVLARAGRFARTLAAALVALAVFEYWPESASARDVLPTGGHRWLAGQRPDQHAIDCTTPLTSLHVSWLLGRPLTLAREAGISCRDPQLGPRLAAMGHTHAIVALPDLAGIRPMADRPATGLVEVAAFSDSVVYRVVASVPPIVVVGDSGFFEHEYEGLRVWRWMGTDGQWVVRNTTHEIRQVSLTIVIESVYEPRDLAFAFDAVAAGPVRVTTTPTAYVLGPWSISPGDHTLSFRASGSSFRPSEHGMGPDDRPLTVAFHGAEWIAPAGAVR